MTCGIRNPAATRPRARPCPPTPARPVPGRRGLLGVPHSSLLSLDRTQLGRSVPQHTPAGSVLDWCLCEWALNGRWFSALFPKLLDRASVRLLLTTWSPSTILPSPKITMVGTSHPTTGLPGRLPGVRIVRQVRDGKPSREFHPQAPSWPRALPAPL